MMKAIMVSINGIRPDIFQVEYRSNELTTLYSILAKQVADMYFSCYELKQLSPRVYEIHTELDKVRTMRLQSVSVWGPNQTQGLLNNAKIK